MKHECYRHYCTKALTSVRRTIAKFPFSDAQQDTYMSVVNIPQKKQRKSGECGSLFCKIYINLAL